ncbi:1-(5-phosphoribosyl)-5-[(5-phosphoribosylamino)methylideneamino]imidazole-4-carboxamide isomerase [Candidatus Albibeggiatoa sp. nov. BB20]|uniref:1-(5-phosphoribosyl)-5-[(5- phosphoribosylamino)methylideneamino]imidazole-4- carboxamide isomerase n=1 Tax=Candidatus Albibeggiatoa sp. nov. BB20 TaxID=3162723 RepID=UPI0033654FAD
MLVIPAIDLKDGQCVRLKQGRMDDETIFSSDPVAMAGHWIEQGAKRLHIVDLNGAFAGKPVNGEIIQNITKTYPKIEIQVGGGIRDTDTILAYLEMGVAQVILGTKAINAPHFVSDACLEFPGRIIVGLDAKNGKLATNGWSKMSQHTAIDLAKRFEQDGVSAIIYTDINRDGMMQGLNLDLTVELARATAIPIIASGGVTTIEDIQNLCNVAEEGITGTITGRAIYEGTLNYAEAQALADKYKSASI